MKPIAYMGHYDTDNIREAGCVVTRDKDDLKFQRNGKPDRIDELYTADQLREAQVKVLREAADECEGMFQEYNCDGTERNMSYVCAESLRRMASELEKADAIRGLA